MNNDPFGVGFSGPIQKAQRKHVEAGVIAISLLQSYNLDYINLLIPSSENDKEVVVDRAPIGPFYRYSPEELMKLPIPEWWVEQLRKLFPDCTITIENRALTLAEHRAQIVQGSLHSRVN